MAVTTNTIRTYALDGATKQFQVPFDYLSRSFVRVSYISASGQTQLLVAGTDFQWTSNTTIETTAVPDNTKWVSIEVRRYTSTTQRVVTFQDGSILHATDLNRSELQAMHIAEEARDASSMSIAQNTDGNMDSKLRRIVNVANGVDPTDAVNMNQLKIESTSIGAAATKATQEAARATTNADNARYAQISAEEAARRAAASADAAKVSETNIIGFEAQTKDYRDDAEKWAIQAKADAGHAQLAYIDMNRDIADATVAITAQADKATAQAVEAKTQADRSHVEADRAKAEADKIAAGNELINAITGVGAAPAYIADFKSLPTVMGKPITEVNPEGGFQVNAKITATSTDDLNDPKFSGKTFVFEKTATNAPPIAAAKGVMTDVYGFIGDDHQRMQMCFDNGIVHVRQQQLTSNLWEDWFNIGSLHALELPAGTNINNIGTAGFYSQPTDSAATSGNGYPEPKAGVLIVMTSDTGITQQYSTYDDAIWFRTKRTNGYWSQWYQNYTTANKPTTTDLGVYSKAESDANFVGIKALAGEDLNTIKTVGMYGQASDAQATEARHYPKTEAGTLLVSPTANGVMQEYTTYGTLKKFARGLDSAGNWAAWKEIGSDTGGDPVSAMKWVPLREAMWEGHIPADGQLLSRTLYPDLWKLVETGKVPVVQEAAWTTTPSKRGSYTTGDGTSTFRIPDYNGRSAGSLGALFQRGDGANAGVVGEIQDSQNKSHTHTRGTMNITGSWYTDSTPGIGHFNASGDTGAFFNTPVPNTRATVISGGYSFVDGQAQHNFDASRSWTGETSSDGVEEARPANVAGCWSIKAFGKVLNEGQLNAAAIQQEFEELKKTVSGDPVLAIAWVQKRAAMWDGYVPADGGLYSRASYPEAWKAIQGGLVPVAAEADWVSDAHTNVRGMFTEGDGSTTFRVPDYNGKSVGAFGPVYLGGGDAAGGTILRDRIQNITGTIGIASTGKFSIGTEYPTGVFDTASQQQTLSGATGLVTQAQVSGITFDASRVARAGDTTRPITVEGCWAVKLFGAVKNTGSIDIAAAIQEAVRSSQRGRNLLINGDFRVNQRGFPETGKTLTKESAFIADRWIFYPNGSCFIRRWNANETDFGRHGSLIAGQTTGAIDMSMVQRIEAQNTVGISNKNLTFSFEMYSSATTSITVTLTTPTVRDTFVAGAVNTVSTGSVQIATGEHKYSVTLPAADLTKGCGFGMVINSLDGTFKLSKFQLEVGSVATDFERTDYGTELAKCQRYYRELSCAGINYQAMALGYFETNTAFHITEDCTSMRVSPSVTAFGSFQGEAAGGTLTFAGANTSIKGRSRINFTASVPSSVGVATNLRDGGQGTARLVFDAEL